MYDNVTGPSVSTITNVALGPIIIIILYKNASGNTETTALDLILRAHYAAQIHNNNILQIQYVYLKKLLCKVHVQ